MPSKIEWCDETINPVIGCTKCSPGCENCYAERMAGRLAHMGNANYAHVMTDGQWNGRTVFVPEQLQKVYRWRRRRRIFVDSMGDLFHESVDVHSIHRVFVAAADNPHHTFLLLTKRPEAMLSYFIWCSAVGTAQGLYELCKRDVQWPLKNVWLGVTVCNQDEADEKIPILMRCPAAENQRFISVEPMLGPVNLMGGAYLLCGKGPGDGIRHVICGGESGPGARCVNPAWVRSLRDQCGALGKPFMFKQWGEWGPLRWQGTTTQPGDVLAFPDGQGGTMRGISLMRRMGKVKAGRLLDGVEHMEVPQ